MAEDACHERIRSLTERNPMLGFRYGQDWFVAVYAVVGIVLDMLLLQAGAGLTCWPTALVVP